MKLESNNAIIYIDDNSDEAKKIEDGYGYSIVNGELIISSEIAIEDKSPMQLKKKIKNATTVEDLKNILLKLIKII
jgi:hypothetical protein